MRLLGGLLRLYHRSGMRALVRASRILRLVPPLAEAEAALPELSGPAFRASGQVYPARGSVRARVGLLSGCVMPIFQGSTMEAAVRVLTRNGCEVHVPASQGCCGSLNLHGGDLDGGRAMARRNIDAFLDAGVDVIVTASAGCGASMKEAADLFRDDPAYLAKAERFGAMTQDITEFLASLPVDPPRAEAPMRVTYQDSCHLVHAQRLSAPPRELLAAIPGLELVEMPHSDRCCGAGGSYQITQREMSGQLRTHKLEEAAATGAGPSPRPTPAAWCSLPSARGRPGCPCASATSSTCWTRPTVSRAAFPRVRAPDAYRPAGLDRYSKCRGEFPHHERGRRVYRDSVYNGKNSTGATMPHSGKPLPTILRRPLGVAAVLVALVALLTAACSGDDATQPLSATPTPVPDGHHRPADPSNASARRRPRRVWPLPG